MASDNQQQDLALLLNAYLDGELTPAQTQKLEDRLATDPAARQLLEELRQVSQSVQQIPHEPIPVDLVESIQHTLERDFLIGQSSQELNEQIGKRHLAWRKFTAAAAILVLTAGVVTIAYRVLFQPNNATHHQEPIVAIAPPKNLPESLEGIEIAAADNAVPQTRSTSLQMDSALPDDAPEYITLNLKLDTDQPIADARILEMFLAENYITPVLNADLEEHAYTYAFMCSPDQLRSLYQRLENPDQYEHALVVSLTDPLTQDQVSIPNITESQLIALATDPRPYIPRLLAQHSTAQSATDTELVAASNEQLQYRRAAPSAPAEAETAPSLGIPAAPGAAPAGPAAPNQPQSAPVIGPLTVAEAEPPMLGLQPLADIEPCPTPPCPDEMLTRQLQEPCQTTSLPIASTIPAPTPDTEIPVNPNQWVAIVVSIQPTTNLPPITANESTEAAPKDQPPVSPTWLMQLRDQLTPIQHPNETTQE
ncbi:MAG: hypothetical protein JW936_11140 [Sedimentisphaerales bacterium]|nr:hypothetical protein [Sedimentisphaerales bacterium]